MQTYEVVQPEKQNGNGRPKVVRLRPRNEGSFQHTIEQAEMEEAEQLRMAIGKAKRAFKKKIRKLEQAYRCGAVQEPGYYRIEEVLRKGGGMVVARWVRPGIRIAKAKAG